jgi:hypothetical protein
LERDPRIGSNIGRNRDWIHDPAFFKIFQNPQQVGRINPEHRGAEASAVIQRNDKSIRILCLQAIHEVNLRTDGPRASNG